MKISELRLKALGLPDKPGVYMMRDKTENIIYIGKAKALKKRVPQYFAANRNHTEKVIKMVENTENFSYIITDSEFEALVLECSLIKNYTPKYNILLKDSKGYSYIKVTNGQWPKICAVKRKDDDDAAYFGPYMNSYEVKRLVEEVLRIFQLPDCNKNFSTVQGRPCLNYHIKKCAGPCCGNISYEEYMRSIKEAVRFIKNGDNNTISYLEKKMQEAAANLEFERAAKIRDKITAINLITKEKQKIVSNKVKEQDVIAIVPHGGSVSVEVFMFSDGSLYETKNFMLNISVSDDIAALRTEFLVRYYDLRKDIPKNITLDGEIYDAELIKEWLDKKSGKNVKIFIPARGEQLRLVEMCKKNAYEAFGHRSNAEEHVLESLKDILNMEKIPYYIEAYDVSNLQGSNNVGAMVVFVGGKPFKSCYRRFKLSPMRDDYSSMAEMLRRRIKNFKKTNICTASSESNTSDDLVNFNSNNEKSKQSDDGFKRLPDLILIDGGIEHTKIARKIFAENGLTVPIFGIVKDTGHKTRALTTDKKDIGIQTDKNIYFFISRIQDEVHRYAIYYHKNLRNKSITTSVLTAVDGIGKKKTKLLLKKFGGIKNIANSSWDELTAVKGIDKSLAKKILVHLNKGV
jgi:excinuclease ABC subunit C